MIKIVALSLLLAIVSAGVIFYQFQQKLKFFKYNGEILNDRPIVGVFAYPSEFEGTYPSSEYNYVGASYVKWIEQGGARVIPIPYDLDTEELKSIFSKINSLVFPGGFWNIFKDADNEIGWNELSLGAKRMLDLALQANYDGDYFPIYGIQSGLQLILALLASDGTGANKLFYKFQTQNMANEIEFMRYAKDRMWSTQDDTAIEYTANNKAQFFYANYSMSVKSFLRSDVLRNTFDITAMSDDDNGQKFIAAVQGKTLPIYGTQFFAQGNIFEWKQSLKLDHNPETINFNQQLANFYVQDTRRSKHTYKIPDDQDQLLIYNFNPQKIHNDYFEQIYFFEKGDVQRRLRKMDMYLSRMASTNQDSESKI